MPANKNAVIRYMILDPLLADRHHSYTRQELTDKCNEMLRLKGYPEVDKRTIEHDVYDIEEIFGIALEEGAKRGSKNVVCYQDKSQSAFAKQISSDEKKLLKEVLNTLGQFSGLDNFEWLEDLQAKVNDRQAFGLTGYEDREGEQRKIISFSCNLDLENKEALGWFFTAISNRKVVSLDYNPFDSTRPKHYVVYPYQLKQYNDRWYLICVQKANKKEPYNPDFVLNLPLDRISTYEVTDDDYLEYPGDLEDRFDDIIGITYMRGVEKAQVLFCVDTEEEKYIKTKPLHWTQKRLPEEEQKIAHSKYPQFDHHTFYSITCIPDKYELPRLMKSFGANLVVLSPDGLREQIQKELKQQYLVYQSVK